MPPGAIFHLRPRRRSRTGTSSDGYSVAATQSSSPGSQSMLSMSVDIPSASLDTMQLSSRASETAARRSRSRATRSSCRSRPPVRRLSSATREGVDVSAGARDFASGAEGATPDGMTKSAGRRAVVVAWRHGSRAESSAGRGGSSYAQRRRSRRGRTPGPARPGRNRASEESWSTASIHRAPA